MNRFRLSRQKSEKQIDRIIQSQSDCNKYCYFHQSPHAISSLSQIYFMLTRLPLFIIQHLTYFYRKKANKARFNAIWPIAAFLKLQQPGNTGCPIQYICFSVSFSITFANNNEISSHPARFQRVSSCLSARDAHKKQTRNRFVLACLLTIKSIKYILTDRKFMYRTVSSTHRMSNVLASAS